MSRHHHAYSEASILGHDVSHLSINELETLYGIQFIEGKKNGKVGDNVTGKEYATLAEWQAEQVEEDSWSDSEHHQISRKFDEDF